MFTRHRKWIWGLLAAVMVLGGCRAEEKPQPTVPAEDVRDVILQAARTEQPHVGLDAYGISVAELNDIYNELLASGRLPWYMDKSWSYDYRADDTVVTLYLSYLDPAAYDRQAYEEAALEALSRSVHPGMTDLQIALALHDDLAAHCRYDESLTHKTEYDALVNGVAVCQGYAEAYMDLLHRAGVECVVVDSEAMNHGWNLVKLEGQWYHVDVTWDDPSPDTAGQVNHDHFLRSDAAFSGEELGYHSWVSPHAATDERYDDGGFWTDVDSQICYVDADTCYLRRRTEDTYQILRRDESTGQETAVCTWYVRYVDMGRGDGKRVHYQTAGLTMAADALYLTDIDRVLRLNPATAETTVVYEHDTAQTRQVLIGSHLSGQTLTVTAMNADQEKEQIPISLVEP